MLKLLVLLNVFKHPVAAHVVLMSASDAEQAAMVADDCATELRNIVLEVDKVFALLVSCHVVEVNILVAPLKVMNDALVGELLFDDEDILEEIDDALFDVKVIELSDHGLLILEVLLVLIDESIALVNDVSDIVENSAVVAHVHLSQLFG